MKSDKPSAWSQRTLIVALAVSATVTVLLAALHFGLTSLLTALNAIGAGSWEGARAAAESTLRPYRLDLAFGISLIPTAILSGLAFFEAARQQFEDNTSHGTTPDQDGEQRAAEVQDPS